MRCPPTNIRYRTLALANCLSEQLVQGRNLICRQGDVADRVIFLRQGQVDLLRTFDVNTMNESDVVGNDYTQLDLKTSGSTNPIIEMKRRERELKARQSQLFFSSQKAREPHAGSSRRMSRFSVVSTDGLPGATPRRASNSCASTNHTLRSARDTVNPGDTDASPCLSARQAGKARHTLSTAAHRCRRAMQSYA